ncbi:MAG: hypothetical protein OXU34_05415, partial [Gammaproteobacteria bacterium]|nr:hypothetical protein [Gammaproteobacteria bacterium]
IFLIAAPPAEAQTAGTITVTSDIDRDSTTDGVQINEGDTVALTLTANGLASGSVFVRLRIRGGDTNPVDAGDLTSWTYGPQTQTVNSLP